MDTCGIHDDDYLDKDASPSAERMRGVNAREILTRVELELAYSSEKVPNLEILLMQVIQRANDYEALTIESENEDVSSESLIKAFEFDLLSGILNSEIKELEGFMASVQIEIADAQQINSQNGVFEEASTEIKKVLFDAEETLKKSCDLVADIRKQSEKFERTLRFHEHDTCTIVDEETEYGHLSSMSAMWKPQSVEQQRHDLQMLEKSLARELDLEKKLSDSRYSEQELKMKLHYADQEAYCMGETIEIILERMFEAENAAELYLGILKELAGEVDAVQFDLNGALGRECQMKSQLQESMMKLSAVEGALKELKASQMEQFNLQENSLKLNLKEAEERCFLANSESQILREKVTTLEEKLRGCESLLHLEKASVEASHAQNNMLHSEFNRLKNVIENLRENVLKTENRAGSAEERRTLLTETNNELNQEIGFFNNNGTDKAIILERKLHESDTQLEHAKVSVEAIEERQNVLYSALSDMGNLIEDLKGKVSKAESRAERAESKCTLLIDTNMELNEELGVLRGRYECLETSLHQSEDAKAATAKDIGVRSKMITDFVVKLSLERERLQVQISALAKTKNLLLEKCLKTKVNLSTTTNHQGTNTYNKFSILQPSEEALAEFSTTKFQVEKSAAVTTGLEESVSAEEDPPGVETVRTTEMKQVQYLWMAFVAVLVSGLAFYLFQYGYREN